MTPTGQEGAAANRLASRLETIASDLEQLPPLAPQQLLSGLVNSSLLAGEAIAEGVDSGLIPVEQETRDRLARLRDLDRKSVLVPSHRRAHPREVEAAFADWRVRLLMGYAAKYLGETSMGAFDSRGMDESQERLVWGERARTTARVCRSVAEQLRCPPCSEVISPPVTGCDAAGSPSDTADGAAASSETSPPLVGGKSDSVADDEGDEPLPLPLTAADQLVLQTLQRFDASVLVSIDALLKEMPALERIGKETARESVLRLIQRDLAERPEGDRMGVRLTRGGRQVAVQIGD